MLKFGIALALIISQIVANPTDDNEYHNLNIFDKNLQVPPKHLSQSNGLPPAPPVGQPHGSSNNPPLSSNQGYPAGHANVPSQNGPHLGYASNPPTQNVCKCVARHLCETTYEQPPPMPPINTGPIGHPGTGPVGHPGTGPVGQPGTGPVGQPGTGLAGYPGTGPVGHPGTGPGSHAEGGKLHDYTVDIRIGTGDEDNQTLSGNQTHSESRTRRQIYSQSPMHPKPSLYPHPENCSSYLETCCPPNKIKLPPITPPPPSGCGVRNSKGVGFNIVGDKHNEAQFGEFPWHIAILTASQGPTEELLAYTCGGTLIEADVVLTAAHCLQPTDKPMVNIQNLRIRAGEWDIQTSLEPYAYQDRIIRKVLLHPDYEENGLRSDVALIFLNKPFELAPHINTVCLPSPNEVFDLTGCFASGWGKDKFGWAGKYQLILKRVELPLVSHGQCEHELRQTRLGQHFILGPNFICAGGREHDTCTGDGGSPLVCPTANGRYVQAGIVSWGIGCFEAPGVYVNVARFKDWIMLELSRN